MRSDKPYRRGWCTDRLNAWQRERRAIHNAEAEAWRARTKHASGEVRGLLCGNCNRAIGLLDENPDLFDRAKEYIARFKS
jgi:hypothetical protein